jgi:hypothetical protein
MKFPTDTATYMIFDSMDRPASPVALHWRELHKQLAHLNEEAEDEGSRLTYAIGKIDQDGDVTFEF